MTGNTNLADEKIGNLSVKDIHTDFGLIMTTLHRER